MEMNGKFHSTAALPLEKTPRYSFSSGCANPRIGFDTRQKRKISCPYREFNPDLLFMCLVTMYLQEQKFSVSISNCFDHILISSMTNNYLFFVVDIYSDAFQIYYI